MFDRYVLSSARDVMQSSGLASLPYSYLPLNTGTILNRAFAVPMAYTFTIQITPPAYSISTDLLATTPLHEAYQLSYGGILTTCLSVSASAQGLDSVLWALEQVPGLRRLGPNVIPSVSPFGDILMTVTFSKPLSYEISVVPPYQSSCPIPFTENRVIISPTNAVTYRYHIRPQSSVVLQVILPFFGRFPFPFSQLLL